MSADKQSLLDRLSALKPTGISSMTPPGAVAAEPPTTSREDALASRLKSLRLDEEASQEKSETKAEALTSRIPEPDDSLLSDDAADDLLMEIAEMGLGDEDVDEDMALPDVPSDWPSVEDPGDPAEDSEEEEEEQEEEHSQQVEQLLQQLAGTPIKGGPIARNQLDGEADDSDSDDSDGDAMAAEVRRVLDRAKDEAVLETETEADADNTLGLPAVPTDDDDDITNTLALPSAPTQALPERGGDDDISQRLAALRGLRGTAAGLGQTDAFGLPSAPTFRPGEGSVLQRGHRGFGRANYTDADQQTWCIVCLEDATVRCVGCAEDNGNKNNAYCEGCWRDMHVGPAAGFDERGHKRVPLQKT